jgi:hypothetical protein
MTTRIFITSPGRLLPGGQELIVPPGLLVAARAVECCVQKPGLQRDRACGAEASDLVTDANDAHAGKAEETLLQVFCAFGEGRAVRADALRPLSPEGIDALGKGHLHHPLHQSLERVHVITLSGFVLPATCGDV